MLLTSVLAAAVIAGPQPRLAARTVASGLAQPVAAGAPPGDVQRLFVAELGSAAPTQGTGRVRIVDLAAGGVLPTPFLTLPVGVGGERGLLGMAFDPAYASTGHIYLHHSTESPRGSRLVRYTVSSNPNLADPQSAVEVLFAPQSGTFHQGGWLEFGPDGYLYTTIGELQAPSNAQLLGNLFGKVLRIDVATTPYSIPPTNPFFGSATARQEIWAYGLRNPWRCGFDRATGDLWIGDVGEQAWEEINFQPAAATPPFAAVNYGWPNANGPGSTFGTPPIYSWMHGSGIDYVVGGYVYRGAAMPWLRGAYFFWRRGSNSVWSLRYDGAQVSDLTEWTAELQPSGGALSGVVSFGEDARGELYMVSFEGSVHEIRPWCPANCDGSPSPALNLADFGCFQTRFALQDPYADCNGDGALNLADFGCFQTGFALGCP